MVVTASRFYQLVQTWQPRLGLPVFPCNGKVPAIPESQGGHGCLDATTDEAQILEWAQKYPNANAAFTFRPDGPLIGIDVDHDKFWWWDQMQREHGLVETFMVKTGNSGIHAYFQRPRHMTVPNVPKTKKGGFECKSDNLYLMAPGSIHPDTLKLYEVIMDIDPQPAPDWLLAEIQKAAQAETTGGNGHKPPKTGPIYEGQGRNSACAAEGGRLMRVYKDEEIVKAMVRAYNEAVCVPPLTEDELQRTVWKSLPKWADRDTAETPDTDALHMTDAGNALRLLSAHGRDMKYCRLEKDWYTFNSRYWDRGIDRVYDYAKEVPRMILAEAAAEPNEKHRDALAKWALSSESMQKTNAMIEYCQSDELVRIKPEDFNRDVFLLNCRNGTLDLRSLQLKPHDRADLITRMIPTNYVPEADRTKWDEVIGRLIPDADTRRFFQAGIGYSATGSQKEKAFFLMLGPTDSGKSTLLGIIRDVLGPYAGECDPEVFMSRTFGEDSTGPNEAVANLRGIRFLTCTELQNNRQLNTEFVKRATGTESLPCNRKHEHAYRYKPEFKVWFSGNHAPRVTETNSAIWNRVKRMEMVVSIPKDQQDKKLHDTLVNEHAEAVLSWIADGGLEVCTNGLIDSAAVTKATAEYRAEQDVLANFLAECTIPNAAGAVLLKDLFRHYSSWVDENTEKGTTKLGKIEFSKAMTERGFTVKPGAGHKTTVFGISMIDLTVNS